MATPLANWQGNNVTLLNARLPDAALGEVSGRVGLVDIRIVDGEVASIGEDLQPVPHEVRHDCEGGLVLPAFVDVHTHLDKAHIWGRTQNPDGSFIGALRSVASDRAQHWSAVEIEGRMDFAMRSAHAHGTAAIRTHLDSDAAQRAITWPIFEAVQQRWAEKIELQPVALIGPDQMLDLAEVQDVARWARRFGGVLGGAIAKHPDARTAVANVVRTAAEFDLPIDLHCDETLDPEANALLYLAQSINDVGYAGRAQAGHCCSLATKTAQDAQETIERTAEAGIDVVALPMCNMYLQDRQDGKTIRTPRSRGITLIKELSAAGVVVSVASDNARDPFYAYGDMDMLEVFRELVRIGQIDHPSDEAWDWLRATAALPAASAGFAYRGVIAIGSLADLIILRARTWSELHSRPQNDRIVVRSGRTIDTTPPDYRELDEFIGAPR